MGVELGQAIKNSLLCRGQYRLGQETIRATVIGAGSHSARLSGSTVFCRNVALPLKNLPVITFTHREQEMQSLPALIRQRTAQKDTLAVLAFPGYEQPRYSAIAALAERILQGTDGQILLCLQSDMAKALGQYICLQDPARQVLCLDGICLQPESYLDIGRPVGCAFPVVVKTLILEKQ